MCGSVPVGYPVSICHPDSSRSGLRDVLMPVLFMCAYVRVVTLETRCLRDVLQPAMDPGMYHAVLHVAA